MKFSSEYEDKTEAIIGLFSTTFAASEGKDEGDLIGGLVTDLLSTTLPDDLYVFTAWVEGALVGGCIFSRLTYEEDDRSVFILSPVAVDPGHQSQGIGQALLKHGLGQLRSERPPKPTWKGLTNASTLNGVERRSRAAARRGG